MSGDPNVLRVILKYVDRAFETIAERDVKTAGEDFDDLNDGTYQRLEDLGYV